MNFIKNIYTKILDSFPLLIASFFLFGNIVLANEVFVSVDDTVAGEETSIRISNLLGGEKVGFELFKPDEKNIRFADKADEFGVLHTSINALHLRDSGVYKLKIFREALPGNPLTQSFVVLAGPVSSYKSDFITKVPAVPADGNSKSYFKVLVQDAFGNPIPNKTVKIISSRNGDIVVNNGKTDQKGIIHGNILSKTPGISVLTAIVDDIVIFKKLEIVFHLPKNGLGNVGASGVGQFLKAQLFQEDFGEIVLFDIEDLPSEGVTEQNYTAKVIAKDEQGNIVKNYTGKIRFSSSDEEAALPSDYTFEDTDQGEHSFALAFTFGSAGQHTLKVNDLNNFDIEGIKSIQVYDKDRKGNPDGEDKLTIIAPMEGTSSATKITIIGKGPAGTTIKLTDGPTLLIDDLMIDSNGEFTYQTPSLADGLHKFMASLLDDSVFSNEVAVRIDQTPPLALAVDVNPAIVDPGEIFKVEVSANEALSRTNCTFLETSQEFKEAGDVFKGQFQAPQKCGEYPIGCTVADLLENELSNDNANTVKVCKGGTDPGKDTDGDGISDRVEGFEADDDSDCVPNWLEPKNQDSTGNGINDQEDPTNDSDGDGLANVAECKECNTDPLNKEDFECTDDDGNPTKPVTITPKNPNNNTDDDGIIRPTAVLNLRAIGGDKKVDLYWSPAKDDGEIVKYRIDFGKFRDKLINFNETPDARVRWYISNLDVGTKYFFQVTAFDDHGNKGVPSEIAEATTLGGNLHESAVPKTGSRQIIPFALAFIGGAIFLFLSRRKKTV